MNRTWKVRASGDLLIGTVDAPIHLTWFGGSKDKYDNGETASGVWTKGQNGEPDPEVLGIALPFEWSNGVHVPACAGSPVPTMPWKTTIVRVNAIRNGPDGKNYVYKTLDVPVLDDGPDMSLNRPGDLTVCAFQQLGGDLDVGILNATLQIIDGGQYLAL